jgi:hypothetical protein
MADDDMMGLGSAAAVARLPVETAFCKFNEGRGLA